MSWYDFRYTWFLTCLFHDAASSIEGLQVDNCSCGLDETLKELDVTITPFTYTPLQPHAELTCYNWDTIDAYYKFEMDTAQLLYLHLWRLVRRGCFLTWRLNLSNADTERSQLARLSVYCSRSKIPGGLGHINNDRLH